MKTRVWNTLSRDWQLRHIAQEDHLPPSPWMQQQLTQDELPDSYGEDFAAGRIWAGFMTMRVMVALLLACMQGLTALLEPRTVPLWLLPVSLAYLGITLTTRLYARPVRLGQPFEMHWPYTAGLDLVCYALMVWFGQTSTVSYLPLLALPPLICAALGTWRLSIVTVLLGAALIGLLYWQTPGRSDNSTYLLYAQLAIFVLGMLLLTYVLHRISSSLGIQNTRAMGSQRLARLRGRINELVVQSVHDGLIVVGGAGRIRAINPAAHQMLRIRIPRPDIPGQLMQGLPQMQPLLHLVSQSLEDGEGITAEVVGLSSGTGQPPHLLVRTRLAPPDPQRPDEEHLCLLYLQDMQELQQQVRTEKLAAMGRMSASVAHEIRNPLAAIAQAAQLLDEELDQPLQKKLSGMVQTNVQRLGRIVTDILDIASPQTRPHTADLLPLDEELATICADWQHANPDRAHCLTLCLRAADIHIQFDREHLRRIIINLLDNAIRHGQDCHMVLRSASSGDQALAQVWSAGPPLPPEVQAHLFEPFASGHSRSTGLGLYICRELAQRYHASMIYGRASACTILLPGGDMAEDPEDLPAPGLPAADPPPHTSQTHCLDGCQCSTTPVDMHTQGNIFCLTMPLPDAPPDAPSDTPPHLPESTDLPASTH